MLKGIVNRTLSPSSNSGSGTNTDSTQSQDSSGPVALTTSDPSEDIDPDAPRHMTAYEYKYGKGLSIKGCWYSPLCKR